MGKLPIIIRRGTRDNDSDQEACDQFVRGPRTGTARARDTSTIVGCAAASSTGASTARDLPDREYRRAGTTVDRPDHVDSGGEPVPRDQRDHRPRALSSEEEEGDGERASDGDRLAEEPLGSPFHARTLLPGGATPIATNRAAEAPGTGTSRSIRERSEEAAVGTPRNLLSAAETAVPLAAKRRCTATVIDDAGRSVPDSIRGRGEAAHGSERLPSRVEIERRRCPITHGAVRERIFAPARVTVVEALRSRSKIAAPRIADSVFGVRVERRDRYGLRLPLPTVSRVVLLVLLAMTLLCHPTVGVPAPSYGTADANSIDRARFDGYEDGLDDALDDAFQEDDLAASGNRLGESELEIIRRSIVQALGLQRIPDPSKANISQTEYERAHREYLNRVQLSHHGQDSRKRRKLRVFHATEHPGNRPGREHVDAASDERGAPRHTLFFPVEIPDEDADTVDHATLRLLLQGHRHAAEADVELLVYLATPSSRRLMIRERIRSDDSRDSRWIELDSTEVVSSWLQGARENLVLDLEFLHSGAPTRRRFASPVLNVFTASEGGGRGKRAAPDQLLSLHRGRRTECRGDNKKCCRHEMTVIFKDLKGFEFIVQPKTFDAGYCKGRCPPRYNPAHHHALLQSLIWKEDRRKAPRPCCAPSKLAELEILYFDENDSTRLKVSNWKNMRVLECACS